MENIETEAQSLYEVTAIQISDNMGGVRSTLTRHGGTITGERANVKIRLAYPIRKETYGFFSTIQFSCLPDNIEKISSELQIESDILRFLIRAVTPVRVEDPATSKETILAGVRSSAPRIERRVVEPVLTNEELEKKIEEISR